MIKVHRDSVHPCSLRVTDGVRMRRQWTALSVDVLNLNVEQTSSLKSEGVHYHEIFGTLQPFRIEKHIIV